MGLVADTIQTIATAIPDTEYLVVSDFQKTEFEISKISLGTKTAIIYNNLPSIPIDQNPQTITENYPIEIWFVGLQSNFDDVDIQVLLDKTKAIWGKFYSQLSDQTFINLELSDGQELNAGGPPYRVGVESLSGWQFLMNLSLEGCPPKHFTKYDFSIDQQGWTKAGGATFFDYSAGEGWKWIDTAAFPAFGGCSIEQPTGIPAGTYEVTIVMETTSGAALDFDLLELGETPLTISVGDSGTFVQNMTLVGGLEIFFVKNSNSTPDRDFVLKSITFKQGGILF